MSFDPGKFPVCVEQSLQWGEMDALNHINNTVYFKFFENTRISFMAQSGIMDLLDDSKIGPILGHTQASFRIPLTYPDNIKAYLRVKSIGNTSFVVEHAIWSEQHQAIACTGESVTVMINYDNGEKVSIDDATRERLRQFS